LAFCSGYLGEDLPPGRRCRRLGRRTRCGRKRRDHAGVAILHRVDRVDAQFGIVADIFGHQGVGDHVLVSDDIGAG